MLRLMSRKVVWAFLIVFVLAACESSEERAEGHYQNALSLLEEGDTDRAIVEFRNVFQLNGRHREARTDFAALLRELGRTRNAFGQYLRLVEQYPDDIEGRIALAEMAIEIQNWEEAERHGEKALELAPDNPAVQVIAANLAYGEAVRSEDAVARAEVVERARGLLARDPENAFLRNIMLDDAIQERDFEQALIEVDLLLATDPDNRSLHNVRLSLLSELDMAEALEAQLRDMIARFPEDEELINLILRFYVSRGEADVGVNFLRELAQTAEDVERRQSVQAALIQMVLQLDGPEAALTEIDTIVTGADPETVAAYRGLRAGILFDRGDTDEAIAELEAVLAGDVSAEDGGQLKVALARMLATTGNVVGARALVDEVLATDESQVEALKMKAAWFIEEDRTSEAIALLRGALDANPDDADALTLSAQAHARNGDRNLAREFLSLAVEAANFAPEEATRYAQALVADERFFPAEDVLIRALRITPGNPDLMLQLGELYIRMEDWARARQVEENLRGSSNELALAVADRLQAARLASQGWMEDAIGFLENLATQDNGAAVDAHIAVVRARLANGEQDEALAFARDALTEDPQNLTLRYVLAATQSAVGLYDEAVDNYRTIIDREPMAEGAWTDLVRALFAQGKLEEAETALEDGLAILPDGFSLLWAQASFREQRGDIDGAIELYEAMYERLPNEPIVANNLASLLSSYRDDEESLDRAYTIARRLRGSEVAPFQDTYGWIAYRRGDYEEALAHLEPAAAALTNDPLVQYHLAMTYVALERLPEALARFRAAVAIAGPEDTRAAIELARAEVARLEAAETGAETAPAAEDQ